MIGEKIKRIREAKGYSQEYVAQELGISQSSYSELENNKTKLPLNRIDKIAKILDTDILELLSTGEPITFNDNQKGGVANNALVINQLSQDLIEQFKKQLEDKDKEIEFLRSLLHK